MSRALLAVVSACVLFADVGGALASGAAVPSEGAEGLRLSTPLARHELIQAVLDRNRGILAARRGWQAAAARVPQARTLEDPMVSYSLAPLSIGSSDVRYGDVLRLGQRIPYPGTLRLRAAVAEAEVDLAGERLEEVRLRLATAASRLYDELWLVDRGLEINQEHIDLLAAYQEVATGRYAAGVAPQQAPIRAEVEAAHLLHRQTVLRAERRTALARLNALLHRAPAEPLPPPPPAILADAALAGDVETLASEALAGSPEVLARRAEIAARRAAVDLEKLRLRPDFEPMTSYNSMWREPEHRWMVGVSLRLPLWRKGLKASVAEAEARLGESESALDELAIAVHSEIEIALAAIEEAHHVVRLYRNRVLPAARDQIAASRAAFETGAGSMLELIDAERSLRTAELNHLEAVAAAASARAELDRAVGRLPFAAAGAVPPSLTPSEATDREGDR